MIVWGGSGSDVSNTGGRYNPSTDSWTPTSVIGAPGNTIWGTAVWANTKMIVWGGLSTNTGGVYDPAADAWTATATVGAPSMRWNHSAVWTGEEMIVWGGRGSQELADGARYDPSTDTWTALPASPLAARYGHTALWTGSKMIVWGGVEDDTPATYFADGAAYDPATNAWTPIAPGPAGRWDHVAVWDSAAGVMVVWGGNRSIALGDGAVYDPATDAWTALPSAGAPTPRYDHVGAWLPATREMVVWGGYLPLTATGGRIVAAPFECGIGACNGPSSYTCTAGQLGYGCTPGDPEPETCNGLDDDCNGADDDGIAAPSGRPAIVAARSGGDASISWAPIAGATGYDVVSGSLTALRASDGNFTTGTLDCVEDDTAILSTTDTSTPAPGDGTWHLVRAVNCGGAGSYDETSGSQQGSRDAEIAASPEACP
jgi:N-acetylneuraminic acid mutarotase